MVEAKPLCGEHFLRHCPDCKRWFHAHENAGFFRCAQCAAEKEKQDALEEEARMAAEEPEPEVIDHPELISLEELDPESARQLDLNKIALSIGGGAFIGLICWYLLNL